MNDKIEIINKGLICDTCFILFDIPKGIKSTCNSCQNENRRRSERLEYATNQLKKELEQIKIRSFDDWWGDRAERWNGILDIKNFAREVWEAARGI